MQGILETQGYTVGPRQRVRPVTEIDMNAIFLEVTDGSRCVWVSGTLAENERPWFYIQSPWRWNPWLSKKENRFRAEITECLLKAGAKLDDFAE